MHFQDQITKLAFDRGPSQWARTTLPPPVQTKPAAVPADHGLRPDEDECMAPSGPEPRQPHPEDSIGGSESNSSPCALALQYNKLMAKGDHLGVERGLAPQETPERAEKGREGGRQHRNHVDPPGGKHQCSRGDRVIGRHNTRGTRERSTTDHIVNGIVVIDGPRDVNAAWNAVLLLRAGDEVVELSGVQHDSHFIRSAALCARGADHDFSPPSNTCFAAESSFSFSLLTFG